MKKAYIKPQTVSITLFPESVIAMSFGGETDEVWTKKKDNSSGIWGDSQEEEKGGIW